MAKKSTLYIILVILVVILLGLIAAALVWRYFLGDRGRDPVVTCTTDTQCDLGSTCVNGICESIVCNTDIDCSGSQVCINSFCIEKTCRYNSDCTEAGEACSNGFCVPYGQGCTSSKDCNNGAMQCISGICSQCSSNSECSTGYCNGGLCTNSCEGTCGEGQVCVANKQQACCPVSENCGQTCTATGEGTCPYCVNGMRTCRKGVTFEQCTSNTDCVSNKCFTDSALGNVCGYVDAQFCVTNFDPNRSTTNGMCDSGNPYCVRGTCTKNPLGAPCGSLNSCRTANLNVPNVTDTEAPKETYSYYCVNGFCQKEPAQLGQQCNVTEDCVYSQKSSNSQQARLQCINGTCQ